MAIVNDTMDYINTNKDNIYVICPHLNTKQWSRFEVCWKGGMEKIFDINFYEEHVFISPKGAAYYNEEPMVLDLINLLVERKLKTKTDEEDDLAVKITRQNIILRTL